jgi:hypothetical protein
MILSQNKQYMNVLSVATIMWAQESTKSKLRLESYKGFTTRG